MLKNPPASSRDARDVGLIPGSRRSLGQQKMATHSSTLAWRIQARGARRATVHRITELGMTEATYTGTHTFEKHSSNLPQNSQCLVFLTEEYMGHFINIQHLLKIMVKCNSVYFQHSVSSVTQLCPTLCNPMDWSTPSFLVHHQLPELAQALVH